MMVWIGVGFLVPFVLAFWLAAAVGAKWNFSLAGALAGLVGFAALMTGYVALLYVWGRAQLVAFLETEVPILLDRFLLILDRYWQIKEVV